MEPPHRSVRDGGGDPDTLPGLVPHSGRGPGCIRGHCDVVAQAGTPGVRGATEYGACSRL